LREYVKVLEESNELDRTRAAQAEAGEERALEIAEQYRDVGKPGTWEMVQFGATFVLAGALIWELFRE